MEKAYDHLRTRVHGVRVLYKAPAIAVAVVRDHGEYVASLVDGVRKIDLAEDSPRNRVQDGDTFTIGSCSKPVSGYMLANLMKLTKYNWETTIGDVFTELNTTACRKHFNIREDFLRTAIRDMMSHRAGFPYQPSLGTDKMLGGLMSGFDAEQIAEYCSRKAEMRRRYNFMVTSQQDEPGTFGDFVYNGGPILPVAMAERITGKYYTELMHEYVFGPLGMTDAHYGPAATNALPPDGIWNHTYNFSTDVSKLGFVPDPFSVHPVRRYNPHGPAGALQFSAADASKFITAQLIHSTRPRPLKGEFLAETLDLYHNTHTVSGWGKDSGRGRGDPKFLVAYNGDDGASYAKIVIYPYRGEGYWIALNGSGTGTLEKPEVHIGGRIADAVAANIEAMLPVWTTSYIP